MKPIRHVSQLDQILDRSLAWRKKELTGLKFVVDRAAESEHAVLCRAGVALLYAHWEGFIKEAANAYLRFVVSQQLYLSDLNTNFVAIGLFPYIRGSGLSNKVPVHGLLVDRITSKLHEIQFTRWKGVIRTRANLKAAVFRDVIHTLALDPAAYSSAMGVAVDRLVGLRNAVAHGQYLTVTPGDYDDLYRDVLLIVQQFRDQVGDAASAKQYLRTT